MLLLVLTNTPLILSTVRYQQATGFNPFHGSLWDDLAAIVFVAVPPMTGMGLFVLAMGQSLVSASRGQSAYRAALVRFGVLGTVGLVHGLLIWWGDILMYYMIAGFIALQFRGFGPRAQALLGIAFVFLPLILTASDFSAQLWGVKAETRAALAQLSSGLQSTQSAAQEAYTSGAPFEIAAQRLVDWLSYLQDFAVVGVPQLTGVLLIGMGIARLRVRLSSETGRRLSRTVGFKWVLSIAAVGYFCQLAVQIFDPANSGLVSSFTSNLQVAVPPILAVGLFLLLLERESALESNRLARWVAVSGRYSLSIYLFTSLFCASLAYGVQLFGRVPFGVVQVVAMGIFVATVAVANCLAKASIQGPAEWMVRRITVNLCAKLQTGEGK
ncbi:DUF418 domain-containing protein [Leucobacter luti]|uniref:DUF418 domain-containing protein n=1 Tax=Leucobacter luti TaxID=340320 RepID=UPI001C68BFEB|nr:DUF418 domain-containing protein [Leucobacter luti]QYM76778.1 DUF418 domain-containing protein [Leucobacter luti]